MQEQTPRCGRAADAAPPPTPPWLPSRGMRRNRRWPPPQGAAAAARRKPSYARGVRVVKGPPRRPLQRCRARNPAPPPTPRWLPSRGMRRRRRWPPPQGAAAAARWKPSYAPWLSRLVATWKSRRPLRPRARQRRRCRAAAHSAMAAIPGHAPAPSVAAAAGRRGRCALEAELRCGSIPWPRARLPVVPAPPTPRRAHIAMAAPWVHAPVPSSSAARTPRRGRRATRRPRCVGVEPGN